MASANASASVSASVCASSLSTVQFMYFMYLHGAIVCPGFHLKYRKKMLEENVAILPMLYSLKILITSGPHFQSTWQQHNSDVDLVLKTAYIFYP